MRLSYLHLRFLAHLLFRYMVKLKKMVGLNHAIIVYNKVEQYKEDPVGLLVNVKETIDVCGVSDIKTTLSGCPTV